MERRLFNELSQFCFTYVENDDVWFIGDYYSLIFQASISSCRIKNIIRIEDEDLIQFRHYWKIVKIQNKLVILPCKHNKIIFYNIDERKFKFVYMDKPAANTMSYVIREQKLYLISDFEILVLNVKEEKIEEYISIPYESGLLSVMSFLVEGHILIPLIYKNQIIDFCIADKKFSQWNLDCNADGFIASVLDGKDLWLAGCNGSIVKWNYVIKQCVLYNDLPDKFKTFAYDKDGNFLSWKKGWHGYGFKYWYDSFLIDDKVWFIPFLSDSLLYIDKKSNKVYSFEFVNEEETESSMKKHRFVKFLFLGIDQNQYIKIFSVKRNVIYSIDVMTLNYVEENFDVKQIDIKDVEKEYLDSLYKEICRKGIYENNNTSIQELLRLSKINKVNGNAEILNCKKGEEIYQYISKC